MKLLELLGDPTRFFEGVQREDWKPALMFFLQITAVLAVLTPVVNFLGIASTDYSSAYQAQILAYGLLPSLSTSFGVYAYIVESLLIVGLSLIVLAVFTGFIHVFFRVMGGKHGVLNAWKAACYGVGPCIIGGFLPYVALFAAFYSFLLQLYMGPKTLYDVKEAKAVVFLAAMISLVFIEMFAVGTTVGF